MYEFIIVKIGVEILMFSKTIDDVVDYLQSDMERLLTVWVENILNSLEDKYKQQIKENGKMILQLLLQSLSNKDADFTSTIRDLSISIANQRVQAGSNIGEFVYNVNSGREVLQKAVWKIGLGADELEDISNRIHYFFNQFLYFSMSHYSDKQNQIIEEKTTFISMSHKDRLTLLGQMTSSFIHEFRNPLTSIQGFIQLLKAENPEMSYLDIISIELEQLNFRISQFLLLSKKELIGKEKTSFSLNELVEEVLIFLYPSILDGKVKIIKNLAEDMYLHGYEDEIRQVFINIIFNAIDVLNGYSTDPRIEISSLYIDNSHIKFQIANNGPVIPDDLLQTIFEPFVTTKTLGTGLGLFVCKEIIEKHKGMLTCKTKNELTIFSIILPIDKKE